MSRHYLATKALVIISMVIEGYCKEMNIYATQKKPAEEKKIANDGKQVA